MFKICSTCRRALPAEAFSLQRRSRTGLQSRCKACWQDDYVANREQRKRVAAKNARSTVARHRAMLVEYLQRNPCIDCGEADIRCLDFDHRDPSQKVMNVTMLISIHATWARVAAEIEKCDVRCASCHRKRTSMVAKDWRYRQSLIDSEQAALRSKQRLLAILG